MATEELSLKDIKTIAIKIQLVLDMADLGPGVELAHKNAIETIDKLCTLVLYLVEKVEKLEAKLG